MGVHPNSLANLRPGKEAKKIEPKRTGTLLSLPARNSLKAISQVLGSSVTAVTEMTPYLWAVLAECQELIDPDSITGRRLAALKAKQCKDAIATLEVMGHPDEDIGGDCMACNGTGYDYRLAPDYDCPVCDGKSDFLIHGSIEYGLDTPEDLMYEAERDAISD